VWNCFPLDPQDPIKVYDEEVNFCYMIFCVMCNSEGMNLC
jgi:hypothetical protein